MNWMKKALKNVELILISELMKNSRRSDRELARAIGVSQPTITRLRNKLEKEGYIKEYTMIPDFSKLGYQIMGITSLEVEEKPPQVGFKDIRTATLEAEKSSPHAGLMIVNGIGNNKNRLFIDFYENYSTYSEVIKTLQGLRFINVESMDSFLVNLKDETNLRVLSMSLIAQHLKERSQKKP
jgi:DNA-binding Lrp family transcriptional regulator